MRLVAVEELVRAGWSVLNEETVRDRVRGSLLGSAFGDALGAPFEGSSVLDAETFSAQADRAGEWRYTDDTAMTLVLAEHLTSRRERERALDEDELLQDFAFAWRAEPWRGYGAGPPQIFRASLAGLPWRQAARDLFDGAGSFGNGGAMRVAPVALLGLPLADVLDWSRRSARVTHAHPLGQSGAALQAAAVVLAVSSEPNSALDRERFLAALRACVQHPAFTPRLERIRCLLDDERPGRAARGLGQGVSALESVPAAILAFLHAPDSPAEVIEFAVRMGGDTDTIAAMAGAIAGARCGTAPFPARWLEHLEDAPRIVALADRVAACSLLSRSRVAPPSRRS